MTYLKTIMREYGMSRREARKAIKADRWYARFIVKITRKYHNNIT
jgi:hypothetical protein